MPYTIIESAEFMQRGIAVTSSSCAEQVNGLVEVQVRYTIPKSKQSQIDRLFYVDAPPPLYPSCISKASLLTNRLYMATRSVSSDSGFLVIDASYVGALARPGSPGYYLTEEKAPITIGTNFYAIGYIVLGEPFSSVNGVPASRVYNFEYFSKEITVEYVEISNTTAAAVPQFAFADLFVFVKLLSVFGPGASMLHSEEIIFGSQVGSIPGPLGPRSETLISAFNKTPIKTQEPSTFLTPTVKVAKIRYSL